MTSNVENVLIAKLQLAGYQVLTPSELFNQIKAVLLMPGYGLDGLDPKIAEERARNIAAGLIRTIIR